MARKSLRAQLNQIRAWVRQGRTDAWIAHQLEVSTAELREFRRRHELAPDDDESGEVDLRDEIEAEIEAATLAAEEEDAASAREADESASAGDEELDEGEGEADEHEGEDERLDEEEEEPDTGAEDADALAARAAAPPSTGEGEGGDAGEEGGKPRRRRRRGGRGRGRGRGPKTLEATFDHGEKDGYGLWLDPAVTDNPSYAEHWAGHRAVQVEITPEQIIIRRSSE